MSHFVKFGAVEINLSTAPTKKTDFVKAFKGRIPDVEEAFNTIKKMRRKSSK